jgi:hypothetical protein
MFLLQHQLLARVFLGKSGLGRTDSSVTSRALEISLSCRRNSAFVADRAKLRFLSATQPSCCRRLSFSLPRTDAFYLPSARPPRSPPPRSPSTLASSIHPSSAPFSLSFPLALPPGTVNPPPGQSISRAPRHSLNHLQPFYLREAPDVGTFCATPEAEQQEVVSVAVGPILATHILEHSLGS